ncbi:MAG: ACT domain-containing protein [Terriglobales bacterium]
MPKSKEFTVRLEDRPGTLGKCCKALADNHINIMAFSACPLQGQSSVRLIVDNPAECKKVLDVQKLKYTEAEVAHITLPNRVGELARAASRLGDNNININYCYSGIDTASNRPLVFFSVSDIEKALSILEEIAKAA